MCRYIDDDACNYMSTRVSQHDLSHDMIVIELISNICRFLFFELWLIVFIIIIKLFIYQKFTDQKKGSKVAKFTGKIIISDCSEIIFQILSFFCATFSFSDIVDFDVCDLLCAKDLVVQELGRFSPTNGVQRK